MRPISPCEGAVIKERTCAGMADDTAVNCAKMAGQIGLTFGLWTRLGRSKHKLNRIREAAPVCPHRKEHWRTVHWSHEANTNYTNILWHTFNFCMYRSCCFSFSKLVGWHSDERWSELITTCSFRDISNFMCAFDIVRLCRVKICRNFAKMYRGNYWKL